ncbi:type II secretion system protein N [Endozoicomonas sp. Mp262]|uniref:type II secretion system protein N n=1 Tax=Endozoicomonas sp. Mp262 TaxID=2919499 RepID=UPI0021DA7813
MSKRKGIILLSAIGLVAYTGFLLATLPATFVWQHLPANNKIVLQGISGTLWSGQARQAVINNGPNSIQLPFISWSWQPASLFNGHIGADIEMGNMSSVIEGKGSVAYGFDGITLNDVQIDTSASWLAQTLPQNIPGELSGSLHLLASSLHIQDKRCMFLNGSIKLTDSEFSGPVGKIDLGNSNASVKCRGNKLMISLTQSSPAIQTTADITLSQTGQYTLSGYISKGEALDSKLEKGLALLGSPDTKGRYPIDLRGRI